MDNKGTVTAEEVENAPGQQNFQKTKRWFSWKLLMNVVIIGLSACLFGYDTAFISPLLSLSPFVQKYQGSGEAFTARNLDLIVSVPIVGSAMGGLLAAVPLQTRFGRKWSFIIAYATCCVPGSILQLFAPDLIALVIGRFWNALGIAVLLATCPLYLVDLVPVHVRARSAGVLQILSQTASVLGTVIVWAVHNNMSGSVQYKIPLGIQASLALLFLFLTPLLVESPSWLVSKGRVDEARSILLGLRNNNHELVDSEISALCLSVGAREELQRDIKWWYIFRRGNLKRTLTSSMFMPLSQVGGQILVLGYSTVILVQSGVGNAFNVTVLTFTLQLAGVFIGPILMDRIGRRPVCLAGFVVLLLLDIVAGSLACGGLRTQAELKALSAVFILFAFTNGLSFQSIEFLAPAEIPIPHLREPTMVYSQFWAFASSTMTTFAIPQLISPTGANLGARAALIFAGCQLITVCLTYFFLPETKQRTVAEIDEMYNANVPVRKWSSGKKTHEVSSEA